MKKTSLKLLLFSFVMSFLMIIPTNVNAEEIIPVNISVKYLDNKSKMTQISQYELMLHKDDNWKII